VGEMDFAGGDTEVDDCEITFTAESSFSASSYSHEWSGKICGKSMSDTTVL